MVDRCQIAVSEGTSLRSDIGQSSGGVIDKAVGPGAGWLLERQCGAHSIDVSVRHGIARKRAIFGQKLPGSVLSLSCRADTVNADRADRRGGLMYGFSGLLNC